MARAHADLHTHSALSDGTDSPTELVRLADELKLGGIALTDHDTIVGLREFSDLFYVFKKKFHFYFQG